MSPDVVSLAIEDGIAVVTISNPPVNVISAAVRAGLNEALTGLAARADVRAVQGDDQRNRELLEPPEQIAILRLPRGPRELRDIGARAEGTPLGREHHGTDVGAGSEARQRLVQAGAHRSADDVDGGIADRDDRYAVLDGE